LDTGSPATIGRVPAWQFLGKARHIAQDIEGVVTIETLQGFIGTPLDVLLGLDFLGEMPFTIDWPRRSVTFSSGEPEQGGTTLALDRDGPGPIIHATVSGQARRLFLDTGAVTHFLLPRLCHGLQCMGTHKDFHPTSGPFETLVYGAPLGIAGDVLSERWGALPEMLSSLSLIADGILGTPLFSIYRVRFDLASKEVMLWRLGGEKELV
jgi:hypothetical protein